MSLDKELTAVFGQEAEMREIPLPDVEGLIRGGRARRRRRNLGRIGVGAAAAARARRRAPTAADDCDFTVPAAQPRASAICASLRSS